MRSVDLGQAAHLITIDPVALDDPALRDRIGDLARVANHTYAAMLSAVDTFDRRGISSDDGFRSTKTWLVGLLGITGGQADRLIAAVRLLRQLPKLAAAVQAGDVSAEHVQQVVRLANRAGATRLVEIDATLAEAAVVLDVTRFHLVCQRAAAHLDPDGTDPGEAFERRGLSLGQAGAMSVLRGQLDPEGAAALQAALDALMAPPAEGDERTAGQRRADALVDLARLHLSAGDLPTAGGQRPQVGVLVYPQTLSPQALAKIAEMQGDSLAGARLRQILNDDPPAADPPAPTAPDPRAGFGRTAEAMQAGLADPEEPSSQDRGDAAGAAACPADPAVGPVPGNSATGEVIEPGTTPASTTPANTGAAGSGGVVRPVWSLPGWADPAWLDWVGAIPHQVAQRIACDADIWRIILDPETSMPLDVGRAHRLVPYWMRKALYARDRTCRWPGCHTPAQWTDAHHMDGWFADSGETKVDRCILLCRFHHVLVHERGWSIDLDPATGEVNVTRPDGTPYQLPRSRSPSWNGTTTTTGQLAPVPRG